jgi:hypothetical protein
MGGGHCAKADALTVTDEMGSPARSTAGYRTFCDRSSGTPMLAQVVDQAGDTRSSIDDCLA